VNNFRNNAPYARAGAVATQIGVQPGQVAKSKVNRYGMSEAEYQSYLTGCRETSQLCEDYLAFYTQLANAPFTV